MRWLVVGSSACLRQVALDAQTAPTMGDLVLLPRRLNAHDPSDNVFHGTWDDLEAFLGQQWSGIVIATQKALPDHIIQRLMFARLSGARVLDLCDFYERQWRKLPVYHLHDGWFAITHGFSLLHHPARNQLKKLVDIGLALVIGTLAAPLMLAAAVAVKLSSSGPVLFRQERVGRFGRTFQLLKFRTMQLGSERGNRYTAICDPRVTTLGRLLRKTRIDELPQIWNVLRGDMSFIGPRAEWTKCVADYEQVIPFYHLRHLIRPGVTGWAQVNYPYGASIEDARQKLQFDLYYLKNHSLLLDARIVLKTVRTVLFGLGR